MKRCLLFIPLFFLGCQNRQSSFHFFSKQSNSKIYLQPFEDFPPSHTSYLVSKLKGLCPNITLLKKAPLPHQAWYQPGKRYRADTLIYWLKNKVRDGEVVIGLTSKDISTTKNESKDYGVMGLGFTPGRSCVVSTFRMDKQHVQQQLFKVAIHELGHTQGLEHCPVKTCFMRDAEGGNPTDDEKEFCESCGQFLAKKGWVL